MERSWRQRALERAKTLVTAELRYLAFLNYEVDPHVLRPYLPRGLELDTWNGKAFVSVVGLLFTNARLGRVPMPFYRSFERVDARFCVRRVTHGDPRRGVVFLREIVPRRLMAVFARTLRERYASHRMEHRVHFLYGQRDPQVEYAWRAHGRWNYLRARGAGDPLPIEPESCEAFIANRPWAYTRLRFGRVRSLHIEHPPWRHWPVSEATLDCDVVRSFGEALSGTLRSAPSFSFLAEGSPVQLAGVRWS
jgi:uncharacterized protein YqjF (DUF2071 family)